jgi:site-specific recombinase XerD
VNEEEPSHVAILIPAGDPLARPGARQRVNPAQLYIASLHTDQSRRTAVESLCRLVGLFTAPGAREAAWWEFPWHILSAQETTLVHAALEQRYAPATVRLSLSVLRGVLKQCWRLELMPAEQYQRAIDLPRVTAESEPSGRMLQRAEVDKLISYVDGLSSPLAEMTVAMLAAGLGGGLRRAELATVRDHALTHEGKLRVMGKGRKERLQALPEWAVARIRAWVTLRVSLGLTAPTMFVWARANVLVDKPPNFHNVWAHLTAIGRAAGLQAYTPHDLRRTFASNMLDLGDLSLAQKAMNHKSAATTALYDRRGYALVSQTVAKLEGGAFMKKVIDVEKKSLATIGDVLKAKGPTLSKSDAEASLIPDTPDPRHAPAPKKPEPRKIKTAQGQTLVERGRVMGPPKFRKHGAPLDVHATTAQVQALAAKGRSHAVICAALRKIGVTRGDGSEFEESDVTRLL